MWITGGENEKGKVLATVTEYGMMFEALRTRTTGWQWPKSKYQGQYKKGLSKYQGQYKKGFDSKEVSRIV